MPWEVFVCLNGSKELLSIPLVIGRSSSLEAKSRDSYVPGDAVYTISHKYVSRLHLRFSVSNNLLTIEQHGKNPSFYGPATSILSKNTTTRISAEDVPKEGIQVEFPRELNLPHFLVRFSQSNPVPDKVEVKQTSKPLNPISLVLTSADGDEDSDHVLAQPPFIPSGFLDTLTSARQASLVEEVRDDLNIKPSTSQFVPVAQPSEKPRDELKTQTLSVGWSGTQAHASTPTVQLTSLAETPRPDAKVDAILNSASNSCPPTVSMGFWEWKAHLDGGDSVASNWKPYRKLVADKLEAAYRALPLQSIVHVDNIYAVCFEDRDAGMIQYRLDDHSRWRPIRRRGGDAIDRKGAKRVRITNPESDESDGEDLYATAKKHVNKKKLRREVSGEEDSYVNDGWLVDDEECDDLESDDDSSDSSLSLTESSDSDEKRKRKRKGK